jgi:glycosyltransferase involved in cell wall biosynthesis
MRIVLSNASFKWGGVHRITELLAEGMEARGHDVLVFCRPGSLLEERLRGRFGLSAIARGMDFSPWAIARSAAMLRRFRADIMVALMDKDLRLSGPAARMLGVPVIARRANDRPISRGWYARQVYGRIASHHIANSEATRRTLLASAPWLAPERVTVIHNGIDVQSITSAAPAFLPLPQDAITVGFIGRLDERKGVLDLLQAWPRVAQANGRAQLVIVGRGELEDEVQRRATRLERVTFVGYRDDVAALLKRCDIIAVPSRWEGFGLVAAEALAAGKPVVAAEASSLPEIVRHEQEGLLVPPHQPQALADALIRLIQDPELRVQLGRAGERRAQDAFSHTRMLDQYEVMLQRLARQARSNPPT